MSVDCRICEHEVPYSSYSARLEMCHTCRDDEAVIQLANMGAQTVVLTEAFNEWAAAFNRWSQEGNDAREAIADANRAAAPLMMALREQLGIDETDPREEPT